MKDFEKTSNSELFNYLSASNEALRIENLRLMSEVERLTNNIEVHDAIIVSQEYNKANYYTFTNYTN